MRLAFCLVLASPLLALAGPASADEPTAQPGAAPAAAPVKEKKICRIDADTGSIVHHRTCHTKSEWDQIDQANGDSANNLLNHRSTGHGGG